MGGRSDRTPLPSVEVMQPALTWRPFHREGWVYEEKYDGWRMVVYKYGKGPGSSVEPGRITPGDCRGSSRPSRRSRPSR